ncbi:uncharacterized protein LOC134286023 [Aedes albopictus]|uniref:CCHC-type domain-containing protein n=1 Tax=Aedes albopictus TaxID=7160 RepID=A0ABM1ZQY3_AEDAL
MASKDLKTLKARLRGLRATFSNIRRFVSDFKSDVTTNQINVRVSRLDELWQSINETCWDIQAQEEFEESEVFLKEQADFESNFYDVKSFLLDKLNELSGVDPQNQTVRVDDGSFHGVVDHVRLPQIKLQCFDGNIDEWLSFRDIYTSLIHHKADLPPVEKFHYLKGCLGGEAKALLDPLKITAANYQIAWDTLLKRYNNSKLLRKRQVQALLNLPSLAKESVGELQRLVEGFDRAVQNLDQVVEAAEYKDLLLVELLSSRLDPTTRRGWEEHASAKDKDTVKELLDFLQRRIQILESLPAKPEMKRDSTSQEKRKPFFQRTSHNAIQSNSAKCPSCSEVHGLHICPDFLKLPMSNRESFLRSHSLCRNCLKGGHIARDCSSKYSCRNCRARHHTVMCFKSQERSSNHSSTEAGNSTEGAKQGPSASDPQTSSRTMSSNMAKVSSSQILLATAIVLVEDDQGSRYPARALLDSGSECNFISESLSRLMKISAKKVDISIQGVGQTNTRVTRKIEATVKSRTSEYSRSMEFLILPNVTACLPTATVKINGWNLPQEVELADPEFFRSRKVDIVLGIQAFFSFFQSGKEISLGQGLPTLTESVFGWIVSGEIFAPVDGAVQGRLSCNIAISENLVEILTRFWSCEEVGTVNSYSPEETRCEEQFVRTVRREADGRYTVTLPKDEQILRQLGESREIAEKRLRSVERRLSRNPELQGQYNDFMAEYLELGHMRMVEDSNDAVQRVYLPHHPVIKESSTTTKVRVVFDASCKTSTGISLNDALFAGPIVQQDLRSIILRSRIRQVMVVSDVEKMFRQIWVNERDTPLQCILWFGPDNEIVTYELITVTYGTKSAPFLATRTLKQLAEDERGNFPLAAKAIDEDVYMDDVISGADDVESAIVLRCQFDAMLLSGGFRLRKWASNRPEVLKDIPKEDLALPTADGIDWDQDAEVKTLGLTWLPNADCFKFQFTIPPFVEGQHLTKRNVLSIVAKLFDPLGLLGATITTAKVFMQRLWTLENEKDRKLAWDDQLPQTVGEEWRKYHEQLPLLNTIQVPRCVITPGARSVEFHCFCDASMVAYGATVYVRSENQYGTVSVHLLTSKSKIAPLKTQSLPRLELCGALLSAQLWEKVSNAVKLDVNVYFWTDSTCVLQWIKSAPGTWTTFVANRVAKIQAITEGRSWAHVSGKTNPADLISRGILPNEILKNELWWSGPNWLKTPKHQWKASPIPDQTPLEMRKTFATCTAKENSFVSDFVERFSDYNKLIRTTAYWLRLIAKLNHDNTCKEGFLTTGELQQAEALLIRKVQDEYFSKEIKALHEGCAVGRSSPLRWFYPRITEDGVLRVGGRLRHSSTSECFMPGHSSFSLPYDNAFGLSVAGTVPGRLFIVVNVAFGQNLLASNNKWKFPSHFRVGEDVDEQDSYPTHYSAKHDNLSDKASHSISHSTVGTISPIRMTSRPMMTRRCWEEIERV